jgi:hypothetical protein
MTPEQKDVNKAVAAHYGLDNRISALQEALGDLQAVLARFSRSPRDQQNAWNFIHIASQTDVLKDQITILLKSIPNMEHGYNLRLAAMKRQMDKETAHGNPS